MKLSDIATLIGAAFDGADVEITSLNTLKDASNSELSFVANAKYIKDVASSNAAAIICSEDVAQQVPSGCVALVVDEPYWQMAVVSQKFAPAIEDDESCEVVVGEGSVVSPKAHLAPGAKVGKNSHIMAGAYIGSGAVVGDNSIIYPNVVVYRDCKIGNDCIIHAGTVVGADGFGFASNRLGEHKKIYHIGNAVIEDDVEIGSNVSIDRAVFGSTIIKKGARLDNLIQVAHNCEIGEGSVFAAQSGMAGSSIIGRNNVFGAQSGIAGHLSVAPFNTFAARCGVTKTIKESGKTFAGFPFMEHKLWLKIQAKLARLVK